MKPLSIQRPSKRLQGSWVATVSIKGVKYVLPVVHKQGFVGNVYHDDTMIEGGPYTGAHYEAQKAAFIDPANMGMVIVQDTENYHGTKRSARGYVGVFQMDDFELVPNGFKFKRGSQLYMFTQ